MPLLIIFLLSGISGLVYQVIWVRQFGNIFGSTVYSAALITAIFMLGLGLGSWYGGRIADRRLQADPRWPLRTFARVEVAIGLLAMMVAFLLPNLEGLSGAISSYVVGEDGWHRISTGTRVVRYAVALCLLTPITLLMGSTISILIRHLIRIDVSRAGTTIARLYGVHTLGAACGCFLADFALIPAFGLLGTQMLAVCLNLAAGAFALTLSRRGSNETLVTATPSPSPADDRRVRMTALAMGAAGFCAMGMQMLWFRQLSAMLRSQRNVFSLLLTTILVGAWIGTVIAPRLERRFAPTKAFAAMLTGYVATALLGLATLQNWDLVGEDRLVRMTLTEGSTFSWWMQEYSTILTPFLQCVFVPMILMGTTLPLANAHVQRSAAHVGRRAGLLHFSHTGGAVLGALSAGFLLMPALGVQQSATVLMVSALLSIIAIGLAELRFDRSIGALATFAVVAVVAYGTLPPDYLTRRLIPDRMHYLEPLAIREGVDQTVVVAEVDKGGERRLLTVGFSTAHTKWSAQRYMRMLAHFPLLNMKDPERVLVLAFGVGNTVDAVLTHPSKRVDVVDRSEDVLSLAPYFGLTNHNALEDERTRIYVNDGRQHLRMVPPGTYDLITAEPVPLSSAGVSAPYSLEYYRLARSRLKPGGWMTQGLPIYQLTHAVALASIKAFVEVFPAALLLSGHGNELILVGVNADRIEVDPDQMTASLLSRPRVRTDLLVTHQALLTNVLGSFAGGPDQLATATRDVPAMTDDWPIMEYDLVLFSPSRRLPETIYAPLEIGAVCPRCLSDGAMRPDFEPLLGYLQVTSALYRSDYHLMPFSMMGQQRPRVPFLIRRTQAVRAAEGESRYVRGLVRRARLLPEG